MSQFAEMEWNSKWDWENFVGFGSRTIESPKKLQLADWMIVDDGEILSRSFNFSGTGGNSGASGSDDGHGSSAKSSISASTDSSHKDSVQNPNLRFMTFEDSSGNFRKKMEMKAGVSGLPLEASIDSIEPLIGLKLGKRTYFENSSAGGNVKASFPVVPATSKSTVKKNKSSGDAPIPRCQVEGCNIDLSKAKDYHRKHRVCDSHSKCPKVIVGGVERRFCQQCSRFHNLSEFDEKKRSCRRRLSDHNARRRKPQQETIQFNSTRLSSPFYGGRRQMSFLLDNATLVNSRSSANSTWDTTFNSKFTLTKGYLPKYNADGADGEQLHMQDTKLPHDVTMHGNASNGLLVPQNPTPEVFNPGSKRSLISSHTDAAPEFRRALSLLSSNSWGSCGAESIQVHNRIHEIDTSSITQPPTHSIPEAVPLSSSEFWLGGEHSAHPRLQALATSNSFQAIQHFRTPYEADFHSNMLN